MIKRIVKLTFREEEVAAFLQIFETSKEAIRSFPGCEHLELWQSRQNPNVFFTYSLWVGEEALDIYRQSPLFQNTWRQTKALFADKPEAWSLDQISQ